MKENRIYNHKVDINSVNTRDFYDQRAQKLLGGGKKESFACPYTSVLLGDQNPDHAKQWNLFEKEHILPKLQISKDANVLDLGCGMGRWAEHVVPVCHMYCGVDFSSEMIRAAQSRDYGKTGNYIFINDSMQSFIRNRSEEYQGKFNRLILAGVCMYMNDDELSASLEKLTDMFCGNCVFYITETVGLEQRLTLREFYSETLACSYDAIYRTPEEYKKLFQVIEKHGYQVAEQGFLPKLNDEEAFRETDRWYAIFKSR